MRVGGCSWPGKVIQLPVYPEKRHELTHSLRLSCGNSHVVVLRPRKAQPLVHAGFCRRVYAGFSLRIPSGSVALRLGRSRLVRRCYTKMGDFFASFIVSRKTRISAFRASSRNFPATGKRPNGKNAYLLVVQEKIFAS